MKRDEVQNLKNKEKIQKLDLDKLMNQLIACAIDFKKSKTEKSKADKFKDKLNDENKFEDKFQRQI